MEAVERRYKRNLEAEKQIPIKRTMTKEQVRNALIERRTIIGPNGEKFEIPKHMSLEDMIAHFKSEFGFTHAEITQVIAAAELLTLRPDYRGKLNRVIIDGTENPLRIEIPTKKNDIKNNQPKQEAGILQIDFNNTTKKTSSKEFFLISEYKSDVKPKSTAGVFEKYLSRDRIVEMNYNRDNIIPIETLGCKVTDITAGYNCYKTPNLNNEARNKIEEDKKVRKQKEEQNKNIEKQVRAHYQEKIKNRNKKRGKRLAIVVAVAALWLTGVIVDAVENTRGNDTEQVGIYETTDKIFEVNSDTISRFTEDINFIHNSSIGWKNEKDNQNQESQIYEISQGLNEKSNLSNVMNKYSQSAENPVSIGEITSYQEFEQMLRDDNEAIYISGPAYFEDFSRQMLHGMLKDKYGAERVKATYNKTGENNQNYEFYIRYFKSGSSTERTPEGKVIMSRDDNGRLKTNEYHTLPYEVYELLATIGEFSEFSSKESEVPFDIQGYADRYTDGNLQKAKEELKSRMTYGIEAMKKLLNDRVKIDKEESYRYDR